MKHSPGKTPAFRGPDGEPISGSIAEIRYLRLGGIDQWVLIRGEWLGRFLGFIRGMPLWKFVCIVLSGPEASVLDCPTLCVRCSFRRTRCGLTCQNWTSRQ